MDMQTIILKRQDLFYQNLLALEFDVTAMSKEHRTNFEKKMFCVPNRKAFEVVSFFLFSKLNEVSKKQYVVPWPLIENKHHNEFQKTCFSHLSSLAKESDINFPRVTHAVLSSFGDAFYELFYAFSTHVILEANKRFDTPMLRRPREDYRFHENALEVLKMGTISASEEFRTFVKVSQDHLTAYFKCAKNLVAYIEKVNMANSSAEPMLKDKIKTVHSLYADDNTSSENHTLESIFERYKKYEKKVTHHWEHLENFLSKEEKFWSCISTEIDERHTKPVLKGKEYNLPVPDILKDQLTEPIKAELSESNSNLCILRFFKLFHVVLEFYISSINKGNFSKTYLSDSLKDSAKLEDCFKKLVSLSDLLQTENGLDHNRINYLIENLHIGDSDENMRPFHEELPPSPSSCINNSLMQISNELTSFCDIPLATEIADIDLLEDLHRLDSDKRDLRSICHTSYMVKQGNSLVNESCFENSISGNSCHITDSHDISSPIQEQFTDSLPSDETKVQDTTFHPTEADILQEDLSCFDELKNVVLGGTSNFNLRKSWLLEESLNAQTLTEDLSFWE